MTTLTIPHRYRGPRDSANGGYSCGRIAALLGVEAEVTLRAPPPLERPLSVALEGERLRILDEDRLVAEAEHHALALDPHPPVSFRDAEAASSRLVETALHPFPSCFVCGPGRDAGDALLLRPGPLGTGAVAAPWVPHESLPHEDGRLRPEILWASLDCPGAFAVNPQNARGISVLGRFSARVVGSTAAGDRCVVVGWPLGGDGRKLHAGTALYRGEELVAYARATWILVDHPPG